MHQSVANGIHLDDSDSLFIARTSLTVLVKYRMDTGFVRKARSKDWDRYFSANYEKIGFRAMKQNASVNETGREIENVKSKNFEKSLIVNANSYANVIAIGDEVKWICDHGHSGLLSRERNDVHRDHHDVPT